MTTVDTMDTQGSIEQCIRMIASGCEYIRITAPSIKEAQNLEAIKKGLKARGYSIPLIADIHFTPNAAELAARIVEKVRINPGNYADKKRFEEIEYTDATYEAELERIREKFSPLVHICKEYGTAMRIGTNHGSLSDRILSRYGDTPVGMVESALEFLRICDDLNYHNIVLSMKASNTQVMVQAYRLLVQKMEEEGLEPYPLHLGVTEAGEGEDGRIKSAVGIGTLLEDGLGDTVRVSLTEEPEFEAPVAKLLIDRYGQRQKHAPIADIISFSGHDPFAYQRRKTQEVGNIGGSNVPRVMADIRHWSEVKIKDLKVLAHHYLPAIDKWTMGDLGVDYIYTGQQPVSFMLPNGLKEVQDYSIWREQPDKINKIPLYTFREYLTHKEKHEQVNFISLKADAFLSETLLESVLRENDDIVMMLSTDNRHAMPALRRFFYYLMEKELTNPVLVMRSYSSMTEENMQLYTATDIGGLLIDGFGDGLLLETTLLPTSDKEVQLQWSNSYNKTAFGVLQAARTRMSKTEYISCPSCGRTLFDLQETTAMIRKRTDHLKGIKIGIMGCIVNGPGEMADADYGYVGSGKGKITLYRGKEVVKKGVASALAVDALIDIIKEDDNWLEPNPETMV